MKILDRLSRIFGGRSEPTGTPENGVLNPSEIRLIVDGKPEKLFDFAASSRLHATDSKGDTPLHLAARTGNLAACDLFIQSGANFEILNYDQQTPADVALVEGHYLVAKLLFSLIAKTVEMVDEPEVASEDEMAVVEPHSDPDHHFSTVQETGSVDTTDELLDLLRFEAGVDPEEFFDQHTSESASGKFVALVSSPLVASDDNDGDWHLDLSPARIAGEGIGSTTAMVSDNGATNDFLRVRNSGRKSVKRAIVQTGTRLSIDPEICASWIEEILMKGWCSFNDVDRLVAHCEGNGDLDELRINIQCILEDAGFEFDQANWDGAGFWDFKSDVSRDELADAIEAALTRRTRLPGTQRFAMSKSDELQLLEPMIRAKQELQLGLLDSQYVVEAILDVEEGIRVGTRDPGSVSLRTIIPSRPGHSETSEFMAAAGTLKSWYANGRVMDGKRRREALAALEELDLSLVFQKELVRSLAADGTRNEQAAALDGLISIHEQATDRLILEHLSYARRFAARHVENDEDPEDVFQVAFMGLQRSTRRFDPERGYRFLIYATYWMRQAVTRWRADEGTAIRIPVHRHENITKLERAMDKLDLRIEGIVSDDQLAAVLEWTTDEVRQFRGIPREAEYPASDDDWDGLLSVREDPDTFDQAETGRIVRDALAELEVRQADVIRMRFGIERDSEMTLEEIGQLYGVTRERIRQIESKGLKILRKPSRLGGFRYLLES